MNNKQFDAWNEKIKAIQANKQRLYFKEREIWLASIGQNIGWEEDGKGSDFKRPVLILKKFRKELFLSLPLTRTIRNNPNYYFDVFVAGKRGQVILSQMRTLDSLRLLQKIDVLGQETFTKLKMFVRQLL